MSIAYHDGRGIKTKFLKENGNPQKKIDRIWESTIQVILYYVKTLNNSLVFFCKSCQVEYVT
jgi:hypothetical protein